MHRCTPMWWRLSVKSLPIAPRPPGESNDAHHCNRASGLPDRHSAPLMAFFIERLLGVRIHAVRNQQKYPAERSSLLCGLIPSLYELAYVPVAVREFLLY
jgi:hypothetical protein